VIDLFASPGGLGEGFSAFRPTADRPSFKIHLSIEKDPIAHETLRLRAFHRQFDRGDVPDEYYEVLRGRSSVESLFNAYPAQAKAARGESWKATLG
jgi:DNA (cytosine-5)-methyltransferase 1